MICGDVIHRPLTRVRASDTIQVVARRMRDENVGFVPVVDDDDCAIGVVTDRDLAVRACALGYAPGSTRVAEVMSRELVTCRATDELSWAARLMSLNHVSRVVVTEAGGQLVGVVSLSDVAVYLEDAGATMRGVARREVRDEHGKVTGAGS
jgi:CBS domain-containing protein